MDIETAANIGEAVSGIAILFTLLFSLRQMKHWNENRRYEIGRDLAAHMNNPLVHRGFSVSTVKLHDELTPQELAALSREEKDAMNALMIGMNNIGVLAKNGHLSMDLVDDLEDEEYLKILRFYLNQLNQENFDFVFYIAGVDIHFNDRLGKLKVSDEGIQKRDEIVTENFFSKGIPLCGVLGGGYNKDSKKLVELHSYLHQSCAKLV